MITQALSTSWRERDWIIMTLIQIFVFCQVKYRWVCREWASQRAERNTALVMDKTSIICHECQKFFLFNRTVWKIKVMWVENKWHTVRNNCAATHLCSWSAVNKVCILSGHRVAYTPILRHTWTIWLNIFIWKKA